MAFKSIEMADSINFNDFLHYVLFSRHLHSAIFLRMPMMLELLLEQSAKRKVSLLNFAVCQQSCVFDNDLRSLQVSHFFSANQCEVNGFGTNHVRLLGKIATTLLSSSASIATAERLFSKAVLQKEFEQLGQIY